MNEDKIMEMLGIVKIVFTLIFMIVMSFIKPECSYIWIGAAIITIPIVFVFSLIAKTFESEDTE